MADTVDEIVKIPDIMEKLGWPVAASLMRKWFNGPASNDRDAQPPDLTSVTMAWLLNTPRTKKVYDQLKKDGIWVNKAAQGAISSNLHLRLRYAGFPSTVPFGNLQAPLPTIDKSYINFRAYESSIRDPLDDVFGALGSFTYHVAVEGSLIQTAFQGSTISISKVGIYVHDSYDFEDDHWYQQPLGFWNFDKGLVSKLPGLGYHPVFNSTFRDYRTRYKKGGDFWVYSDMEILRRFPPDTFQATLYA